VPGRSAPAPDRPRSHRERRPESSADAPDGSSAHGPARRWTRRLVPALLVLWALLAAAAAVRARGFALDDFFITFRYAWNLLAGEGFVFNPGERAFGTTAPGLGLLLAAVAGITRLPIPQAAAAVTAAALWAIAALLLAEARARGRAAEAAVAGTLIVTSNFLWVHVGAEGPASLALLLAAARGALRRPAAAGLAAGAAVWLRPDAGLGVALLGLLAWRAGRRPPWRFGAAAGLAIAAGLAAARLWFGRWLPATLEAKRLQAEWMPDIWPSGLAFWGAALQLLRWLFFGPPVVWFALLGAAGLAALVVRGGRAHRLLALYGLAIAVAYPLLGVAFYNWYVIPTVIALLAGAVWGCGWLARRATAFCGATPAARLVAAALVALIAAPPALAVGRRSLHYYLGRDTSPRYELYRHAGLWLREHAPEGEAVAYVEVGTIAYFSRRPVYDLLGLVSPEALPWLERRDLVGAFLAAPTPWLIYDTQLHGFIQPLREAPWFEAAYREAARFRHRDTGELLILYRRRPGAALPPPG
jgi:hypothetical protein